MKLRSEVKLFISGLFILIFLYVNKCYGVSSYNSIGISSKIIGYMVYSLASYIFIDTTKKRIQKAIKEENKNK